MTRRFLREPLIHFLVLGLALFVLHRAVAPGGGVERRIDVTRAEVDAIAAQYQALWGRPPTAEQLAGLVDTWVKEEILYREGVKLGLDRDDAVIKRRVRQKLEVLSEEERATAAPSDADLSAYLARHAARFARQPVVTFEQILVVPATGDADAAGAVAAARSALARGVDPARVGRATLLPRRVSDEPLDLVKRDFGAAFTGELSALPVGTWAGPVASGLGLHLVRVIARTPASAPALDVVRAEVTREWENARRQQALAESYRRLRAQYDVRVDAKLPAAGMPAS